MGIFAFLVMDDKLFEISQADVFIPGLAERAPVLKNINWRLDKGEHCAILGANGAGKSSLLKLLHGDLWPCAGTICWYDWTGQRQESRISARELTAIVSPSLQESLQRSPLSLDVESFLTNFKSSMYGERAESLEKASLWVERILGAGALRNMLDAPLASLSQGQWRLLLLAQALMVKPRVLLLDEYTDGLDAKNRALVLDVLRSLRDEITMIFSTHRPASLPEWCEKRFYLEKGEQTDSYIPHIVQHGEERTPTAASSSAPPLFALSNVSVYIDRHKVLQEIDWRCAQGEHWRIEGENGSGKSTFLRLLAGDEFAAADGEIWRWNTVKNHWARTLSEARSLFMLVSDLSQLSNDYPLCALELVCTGFDNTTGLHREIGEAEQKEALDRLKDFFPNEDLDKLAYTDIRRLSTGQLRRLYLARAMLTRPAALLLDEPLNGLDAASRAAYLESLRRLVNPDREAPAIIMVSHYDEDLPDFIQRRARLENGRLRILAGEH